MKIISKNIQNVPRGILLDWHLEYERYRGKGIAQLLRTKLESFYEKNGQRISSIIDGQNKIIADHYEINADGTVKTQTIVDNGEPQKDSSGNPMVSGVLLEGKTELAFNEAMNAYMKEMVPYEPC